MRNLLVSLSPGAHLLPVRLSPALPHLEDVLARHRQRRARARFMLTVTAVALLVLLGLG